MTDGYLRVFIEKEEKVVSLTSCIFTLRLVHAITTLTDILPTDHTHLKLFIVIILLIELGQEFRGELSVQLEEHMHSEYIGPP